MSPQVRPWARRGTIFCLSLVMSMMAITALGVGCARSTTSQKKAGATQRTGRLMTCLAMVKANHRKADLFLKLGELKSAQASVESIFDLSCPLKEPEAQAAMLDAHGRLATLKLRSGELDEAEKIVERGLGRFPQDSFFRAHLLMIQADVLEARASRLTREGRMEDAKAVTRRAIEALSSSIEINQRLQRKLLAEPRP